MNIFVKTAYASSDVTKILNSFIKNLINPLIILFFSVAVVYFVFGVFKFIQAKSSGDMTKAKEYQNHMLWGIVGLAIMFSVWGIMLFISSSVGADYINDKNIRGGQVQIDPINIDTDFIK